MHQVVVLREGPEGGVGVEFALELRALGLGQPALLACVEAVEDGLLVHGQR